MQQKNKLFEDIRLLKKELNELKNNLDSIDEQKEKWFSKKEECGSRIRASIKAIKESKQKRDELTKKVKEDKQERDKLNQEIKDKISKLKELNKEKELILGKYNIKGNPSMIKESIEKLEFSIETEGMSFENEKKVMKKIKELKKRFGESKVVTDILDKLKEMSNDIDKFKRKSNEFHLKIQNRAKESQELHESIITSSKEIDKIKEEEEQAFEKFIEFKKKFTEANDLLKGKLTKMNSLMKSLASLKLKKGEEKKLEEDLFLKNKEAEVEEKIKKREKLTTEDLLVFQKDNSKI